MSNVIEVSEQTWQQDVLDRSHEAPVVVDFWAEWCGPCRALGPILERLAEEADGDWTLAKLDVDANQGIARQFGIQGIPAVKAFRDGEEVAEFVGALPEDRVRQWLTTLGPSPADVAYEEGVAAEAGGDPEVAADHFRRAISEQPDHAPARAALERLELAQRIAGVDVDDLERRLSANPGDVEAAVGVADAAAAAGRMDDAANILIDAVKATTGEDRDRARLHLLRLLETLPTDHPVALRARKALSLALF